MRVSGFMNVQIAGRFSNQKRATVVSIAPMERFLVRRFSLAAATAVAVRAVQAFVQ
jgi:hypothetical protein